jgi:hypothetical protein
MLQQYSFAITLCILLLFVVGAQFNQTTFFCMMAHFYQDQLLENILVPLSAKTMQMQLEFVKRIFENQQLNYQVLRNSV